MVNREDVCRACEGTGMLADDESWQYICSMCNGDGKYHKENIIHPKRMNVDENNRLLD